MPKAKFIVHAGDLINNRDDDSQWGEWHAAAGWINGMVPSVPTPGNHEYAKTVDPHWRAQFTLPENGPPGLEETTYFLDYQGVRIISLNTEEKVAEQVPWLERVLANNPCKWTVLTFHRPIYSPVKNRDNKSIREAWRPVFDRAPKGVDLVLQGHDHTYGRSGLMRDDNTLSGGQVFTERGTVYCVSVSGPKHYGVGDLPWMVRKAEGIQLYQLIRVNGDRLNYEARTAKGDLYDAFELRKRADGGNELLEKDVANPEPDTTSDRNYWHAAGAILILGLVAAGIGWAARSRSRTRFQGGNRVPQFSAGGVGLLFPIREVRCDAAHFGLALQRDEIPRHIGAEVAAEPAAIQELEQRFAERARDADLLTIAVQHRMSNDRHHVTPSERNVGRAKTQDLIEMKNNRSTGPWQRNNCARPHFG